MDSVTAINVHQFGAGLLVELIGEGTDGDVAVRSFEFEWVDGDRTRVRPVGGISADEVHLIEDRLVAAGYDVVTQPEEEPTSASRRESGGAVRH